MVRKEQIMKKINLMILSVLALLSMADATTIYSDAESGTTQGWSIRDGSSADASVENIYDTTLGSRVIALGRGGSYNLKLVNGESWNNQTDSVLQWKMKNSECFTVTVDVQTQKGAMQLVYTPDVADQGLSGDGQTIHHGLGLSRDGDGVPYGVGTDGRWQTYTRDLKDDLRDYDADDKLIAVNGVTISGTTLVDDVELLSSLDANYLYAQPNSGNTLLETAEDGSIGAWHMRDGTSTDETITNIYDEEIESRVIMFTGGGSHRLGANSGDNAFNNTTHKHIAWRMRTDRNCMIVINVQTTFGLRHLFYTTVSHNRALYHGFEGGIHHGLGGAITDGRWRTITRDLERDLKDADPANELISINGFIFNGGDGGRLDDLVLYTPQEHIYEDGEGANRWSVIDNNPVGATITTIADSDLQGEHRQGQVIALEGTGAENTYQLGAVDGENRWNNRTDKILQWRFRDFGAEVEILDERGVIRNLDAFEFRVSVQTTLGARDLVYTLGSVHLGIIENGGAIHHALGDDRIRGSVWDEDSHNNALGMWQTITRDLEEDIRDFEPNNRLLGVNAFAVRNSGLIDDIKMFSSAIVYENNNPITPPPAPLNPNIVYEDAEDGNTNGWSIFANNPAGATIINIFDTERGSRVISLQGAGKSNGYILGSRGGENAWGDTENSTLQWSMNYNENFTIYISVETTNGRRYLVYTPRDDDRGLRGQYILIGLGVNASNGTWQTFTRNLAEDIQASEADNELLSINAFMIRGSGLLDDIETIN